MNRKYDTLDKVIIAADKAVNTIFGQPPTTDRMMPGENLANGVLTKSDKLRSARLMRVNHAGEVAAQALYQGQALTAKLPEVRQKMERAAIEENDHLLWCQKRVHDLGSHTSVFNPIWYGGSFLIGAVAGKISDEWSLGFVAETERQVVNHLNEHLNKISLADKKSCAVLKQMKIDELHHGSAAIKAGGIALPLPIKQAMGKLSKIMTQTSYWL